MKKTYLVLFCLLLLSACQSSKAPEKHHSNVYSLKQAKVVKKEYKEGENKQEDIMNIYVKKQHKIIRLRTSSKDMYHALSNGEVIDVWFNQHHQIQKVSLDVSVGIE